MLQHGGKLQIIERPRGIGCVIEVDAWLRAMAREAERLLTSRQCLFDGRRFAGG